MARILVVDDRPRSLRYLAKAVSVSGARVVTATSANEAIQRIKEDSFDVIVTDIKMETEEGGLDVLKAAKAKDTYTQVIMITAHGPGFQVESMRLGAFDFLEKNKPGVDVLQDLTKTVTKALEFRAAKLRESGVR